MGEQLKVAKDAREQFSVACTLLDTMKEGQAAPDFIVALKEAGDAVAAGNKLFKELRKVADGEEVQKKTGTPAETKGKTAKKDSQPVVPDRVTKRE